MDRKLTPHEAHRILKEHIVLALSKTGFFSWGNETGQIRSDKGYFIRYGFNGSADILGVAPGGIFYACEAKTRTGKQQPNQIAFETAVTKRGGIYHVCHWNPETEELQKAVQRCVEDARRLVQQGKRDCQNQP